MESAARRRRMPGILTSLIIICPILIGVPLYSYHEYTYLPEPVLEPYNSLTNQPQISEPLILDTARILSEEIGFRTPGTREHALGEQYLWGQVIELKSQCDELVKVNPSRKLECEIWHQKGSGSHRFDMMGKRLYKTYVGLGNIVVRLSDGTEEGKAHSVLVNAHLDSTLPTPGAADDAMAVGIMLECIRVLMETQDWEPSNSIIFLFNNAEESLQDGSHLFSTQHEVASTVRAAINLEAAGTTGRELLFQATSFEMISAYSHVPRPHGTVVANDVFSSGIILSDTDFRQFQQYLNVTGLDIAVVGNSYLYHMRKDLVENIQQGVAQNFGENTLALLLHLSSSSSSISSLTGGYTKPQTVYFSLFGRFWMYSFQTAKNLYAVLFAASIILIVARKSSGSNIQNKANTELPAFHAITSLTKPFLVVFSSFIGALVGANVAALLMKYILEQPLSWFKSEFSAMILYGPSAILGALVPQLFFSHTSLTERNVYHATLLTQTFLALLVQHLGVGSAGLAFLCGASLWAGLVVDPLGRRIEWWISSLFDSPSMEKKSARIGMEDPEPISLLTYVISLPVPLLLGSTSAFLTLDVFVPLTGRLGADAPADNLIATIVVFVGTITFGGFFVPFLWRFQSRPVTESRHQPEHASSARKLSLDKLILFMAVLSAVPIAVFSVREPFDAMHQKRVYFLRTENITTGEHHLHISTSDGAAGFEKLVHNLAKNFGSVALREGVIEKPQPIIMDAYNSDWDTMYPFSAFLTPYKIPLAVSSDYVSPWSTESLTSSNDTATKAKSFAIVAADDILDHEAGTRSLKLVIWHPGLIWTVIAFDAHVLSWSLDSNPPDEYTRHYIKEASFYEMDKWEVDIVIKLPPPPTSASDDSIAGSILINFIGLEEEGMWPGKKALLQGHSLNDSIFASLKFLSELDAWVEKETDGKVDALLLGCVAGLQRI